MTKIQPIRPDEAEAQRRAYASEPGGGRRACTTRGGWRQGTTWWPWQTVARFDTYAAARADVEARERAAAATPTAPTQAAVFYGGKPYRLRVNAQDEILQVDHGAAALRRISKPR